MLNVVVYTSRKRDIILASPSLVSLLTFNISAFLPSPFPSLLPGRLSPCPHHRQRENQKCGIQMLIVAAESDWANMGSSNEECSNNEVSAVT
jgi:hypothetical protein